MAVLADADLRGVLGFLRAAEDVAGTDPFPRELLDRFRDLLRCESVSYCELDRPGRRLLTENECSRSAEIDVGPRDEFTATFWRLRNQHPLCAYQERSGDFSATMLSDVVTPRELHALEIYWEFFRVFGAEYEIEVGLPAPPWHTKIFLFDSASRDFDDRDRLVLDLLRPHLVHLYRSAQQRRLLALLAEGADAAGELVVLDRAGRIEFASGAARRLLRTTFGDRDVSRLPPDIEDWLGHERARLAGDAMPAVARPFTVDRGPVRLIVRRVPGDDLALLLSEEPAPGAAVRLSWREWQVLALVEEGRSNAEIAANLWISPATVRTHLEHIYRKLGVRSRTAAVARARELRAEAPPVSA